MHLIIFAVAFGPFVVAIGENIVDVNDTALKYRPPGCWSPVPGNRIVVCNSEKFLGCTVAGGHPVHIAVLSEDETPVGAAETDRMFEQALRHSFEFKGGATDDLEDFTCRRLGLTRLLQLTRMEIELFLQIRDIRQRSWHSARFGRATAPAFGRSATCLAASPHVAPSARWQPNLRTFPRLRQ